MPTVTEAPTARAIQSGGNWSNPPPQTTGDLGGNGYEWAYYYPDVSVPAGSAVTYASLNMILSHGAGKYTTKGGNAWSNWYDWMEGTWGYYKSANPAASVIANSASPNPATMMTSTYREAITAYAQRLSGNFAQGTTDGSLSTVAAPFAITAVVAAAIGQGGWVAENALILLYDGANSNSYSSPTRDLKIRTGLTATYGDLAITYNTAPTTPVVTAPNGGETVDQSVNVTWTAATDADGNPLQYNVQYSANGSAGPWTDIVALTGVGATSYLWNTSGVAAGVNYKVRVRAWDGIAYGPFDESNAAFSISHQLATPTNITPAAGATVTTDIPTLGGTLVVGGTQKMEWQLATDNLFTVNLRTITESDSDAKTSGATTEAVPNASQLFQGLWYMRARAVPPTGGASQPSSWTATQSFTVTHPPVMANQSPAGDVKRNYGLNGDVLFDWDFSDSSPVDAQTAYEISVEIASSGVVVASIAKTAGVPSQATLQIPVGQKDIQLRWRGRVWDSDDVTGGYSGYNLFRVADPPVPTITSPVHTGIMTQPAFTVTWDFVATGGRTQNGRRIRFVRVSDGVTIHDSGWIPGPVQEYVPPGPILTLGVEYDVIVDVEDTWLLQGSDTNRATAQWLSPGAPAFTVVP